MVFKVFFVISDKHAVRFCLVFLPSTLVSLPPRECFTYIILRDSVTDIEKTYRESAPSESDLIEV